MPDPDALTIRTSGLSAAGDDEKDDFVIKWRGIEIGRIYNATDGMVPTDRIAKGQDLWRWFLAIFPAQPWHQGQADSLDEAKAVFKATLAKIPAECRVPPGYHAGHEDWNESTRVCWFLRLLFSRLSRHPPN